MEQPITTKNVGQPCVICGQAADAQATVAALQARVKELEDGTTALLNQQSERLAVENEKLTMALSQLAQRTAELAAAKKVKADYDRWLSGGVYFTTAEYMAHIDEHRAELERVRGTVTLLELDRGSLERQVITPLREKKERYEREALQLRTLIAALPKVKGAVEVSAGDDGWYILPLWIRCVTKEQADGIAALLQHRQGMEG